MLSGAGEECTAPDVQCRYWVVDSHERFNTMASLILKSFKCDKETSEIGNDSPYFVFFLGRPNQASSGILKRIRQPHWDNDVSEDSGYLYQPGATVATGVDANTVVLCALMEEDNDADLAPGNGAFKKVQQHMREYLGANGANESAAAVAGKLLPNFAQELATHTVNDDIVAIVPIPLNINLEQHGSFKFSGDGGSYRVWFATE